ncbi:MAG: geranylgeranylglycerol-phosphate geranylgeranyltransferase [Salinivirgaceae bacterium]|nr:geranylgeranylglycerol-phosphate geranylgeranyltransferase [Salinivirgaceae bacterium]
MLKYLKLIRIHNLLMVPLTMYLLHWGIIEPALGYGYSIALSKVLTSQFTGHLFIVLILINVLLGAAGYVINDYFDRKIDSINRPKKVIVGKTVHRRFAIILHFTLNSIAILLAGYLSWYFKKPAIVIAYIMIAGIFWLYSTTYKKQFLIGNLIVAAGAAMIPFQVAYFELTALNNVYGEFFALNGMSFKVLFYWLSAFSLFAFLTNLIREIVKDLEDFEGDSSFGCNTLPVALGIRTSKIIVSILSLATIGLLAYLFFSFLNDNLSGYYLTIFVSMPLVAVAILILFANKVSHYHKISWLIKIIMLFGIMYAWLARYIMTYNFNL